MHTAEHSILPAISLILTTDDINLNHIEYIKGTIMDPCMYIDSHSPSQIHCMLKSRLISPSFFL